MMDPIPLPSTPMKKLLIAVGTILSALTLMPLSAQAQDYTYDCLCLYSGPNGACIQYTCDAYQRASNYNNYNNYNNCRGGGSYGYDYGCNNSNYNRSYSNNNYYDGRSNYDWYYNRYSNRSPIRRYNNQYYDYPTYYY